MLAIDIILDNIPNASELPRSSPIYRPSMHDILHKYAEHLESVFLSQQGGTQLLGRSPMILHEVIRSPVKVLTKTGRDFAFPRDSVLFMGEHKRKLISGPMQRPWEKKVKKSEATDETPANVADPLLLPGGETSIDILRHRLRKYGVEDVQVHPYINKETPPRLGERGIIIEDKVQEIYIYFK